MDANETRIADLEARVRGMEEQIARIQRVFPETAINAQHIVSCYIGSIEPNMIEPGTLWLDTT